jgi:hypothetical protein
LMMLLKFAFGNKIVEVSVLELKEFTRKEDAEKMYKILSETRITADTEQ